MTDDKTGLGAGRGLRRIPLRLRLRLVLAAVVVEIAMLTLLVWNGVRLVEHSLSDLAHQRVAELNLLLHASLAGPLAERDYATAQEIMDAVRREHGIGYLVLRNSRGEVAAASGWADGQLPSPDRSLDAAPSEGTKFYDLVLPIRIAGRDYGNLRYGLSLQFLVSTREHLLQQSMLIAGTEIALSVLLLSAVGLWLTRHLSELTRAARAMASGDLTVRVPATNRDEVGELARSFNAMALALEERLVQIEAEREKFHAIADYSYDAECWIDPAGRLLWISPAVQAMTGWTAEECQAMPDFPVALMHPEERTRVVGELNLARKGSSGQDLQFRARRKDGSAFWVAADWRPLYDRRGRFMGTRASIRDITTQKNAEVGLATTLDELRRSEESQRQYAIAARDERARLAALLGAMNIGILFAGSNDRVIYHNPAFRHIWRIDPAVDIGSLPVGEILSHSANELARPDHFSRHVLRVPGTHEVSDSMEIEMADGRRVTQTCHAVRDDEGRFIGRLWFYEDVTKERQTAEQLVYLAERDGLTGLYNRSRFQSELERMLAETFRHEHRVALLFFDLDEFKHVNDTFGHRAGDAMLIRVAGEVGTQVRKNEMLARLGGDEFALLVPDARSEELAVLAERIVRAIGRIPFQFEGRSLRLTTSIGIAVFPDHASNSEELVARADAAMYHAKEAGKNTWRMYSEDAAGTSRVLARLSWNERIFNALERGLLRVHFQGIFDVHGPSLTHLEALVRMVDEEDPSRLIMPGHFIPVAEKTGKILDIDRWVLQHCVGLLAANPDMPPIATNISGRSFNDPSLPRYIAALLRDHSVEPGRLVIELTETSAVADLQDAQRFITVLRTTGCTVSLDDFGSGFSSFAYLKHLPVDLLKIDGEFIRDLPSDRENQVFVRAMVEVARGLKRITVAECVEDEATLKMLRELGVDRVQGYYLEMPRADHPAVSRA